MKHTFWLVLISLGFSCGKSDKSPEGIIPAEKMRDMLIQIHLAEAKVSAQNIPADTSIKVFRAMQDHIYSKFGVDSSTFNKSYRYYIVHVEKMDEIYTAVVDSLSLREARKLID
jgi:hypothetical protein